jgi:putative hydrolase of the HAD superfamily
MKCLLFESRGIAVMLINQLKQRGFKLGIITNGSVHWQHAKIDFAGIRSHFDTIVVSDEVGIKKPDSLIFQMALDRLSVQP